MELASVQESCISSQAIRTVNVEYQLWVIRWLFNDVKDRIAPDDGMMNERRTVCRIRIGRGNRSTRRKPASVSLVGDKKGNRFLRLIIEPQNKIRETQCVRKG
jgi:hypothetical protein